MKKKLSHRITFLIMKVTVVPILLSMIALCCYANDTRGQQELLEKKITLKLQDEEIRKVFTEIEKLTEVKFVYSPELIGASRKVTVNAKKKELTKVLMGLLDPLNLQYELINNYLVLKKKEAITNAQVNQLATTAALPAVIKIRGKVTSADGKPLEGASVTAKNTTNGTTTDQNGEFTLTVENEKTVLVISYVNYQDQEIVVGSRTSLDIKLALGTDQLSDVVVIGYGTQKKVTLTGAVSSVKGDELKTIPTGPVSNTLVGRLPGLIAKNTSGEPGNDDSKLLIRGNNTLGDNSPLVVVDGVADRAGGFSRIDVNDIESVTILKDASAAIYGSRAANGVILVTTKRGKTGKPKVSYAANVGFRSPTVIPDMVDAADYATGVNDIVRLIDHGAVPTYTAAQIQKFRDGSDPVNYPNIDPIKESLKDYSIQHRHNLTVSGGSDNVKYYTSIGYQYENNIFKNSASNYKQYNVRSNIDIQANKDLRFVMNLALRQEDRNAPYGGRGTGEIWRNIVQGDPTQLLRYPNGKLRAVSTGGYNPLTNVDGTTGYTNNRSTFINTDLGFNLDLSRITRGLSVDGRLSLDKTNGFLKSFNKAWVLYTLNNTTGEYMAQQYGPTNATLLENMGQDVGITANAKISYARSFNGVHNLSTFVGYEQYEDKYNYIQAQRQNFVSSTVDQLFAGDTKSATNDGNANHTARQNYFGRLDYSYSEKYLFQFNWRYDGSQNFASNKRFGFFPGISAGWRASEEAFWKQNLSFINYFKVRGSWGKVGNDKISPYQYLTQYTFGQNGIFGGENPVAYTGIVQTQTANPEVSWEVGTTANLGIEARFLNNALAFEFDVFKQDRKDILIRPSSAVPLYAGLTLPDVNDASCRSRGFEASLQYTKTIGSVRFNAGGNFSFARSRIVNQNEAAGIPAYQKATGKPIDATRVLYEAIGVYRTAGDLTKYPGLGNVELGDLIFRDVNGDGVLDANDQVRQARTETPEIIYGITMGAAWKQFSLDMLWQGAGNVAQYVFYEAGAGGIGTWTQDYFDNRWTPENPNAKGPRIYDRERTEVAKPNTYFYKNAAYLRLKSIQLSYSLPKRVLSTLHISDCNVFVSGFNLITITKLKNIDPEATASNQNYAGWFNIQNKVVNLGLNLTF